MQLAFYGSTPAYRPVLELHGWEELQPVLNSLAKQGEWQKMGDLIPDEVLDAFALVCEDPAQSDLLRRRKSTVIRTRRRDDRCCQFDARMQTPNVAN